MAIAAQNSFFKETDHLEVPCRNPAFWMMYFTLSGLCRGIVNLRICGQADGWRLQGLERLRVLPGHFDKQPTHALGYVT